MEIKEYDDGQYEGYIINNLREGYGKMTYTNGEIYEGNWENDMRNNIGTFTDSVGNIYIGNYKNDLMNGFFNVTYPNGYKYYGEWSNNNPYKIGLYKISDSISYDGIFTRNINNIIEYKYNLGYIHIPKTGGTDTNNNFISILYDKYNFGIKNPYNNHSFDAQYYKKNEIKCFCVLRDPIDRFISIFKFYNQTNINLLNINNFIIEEKEMITNYINDDQNTNDYNYTFFSNQSNWLLNADNDNTYIIKYNDINNNINYNIFLSAEFGLKINDNDFSYDKENVSNTDNLILDLTNDSLNFINNLYSNDIALYNKLNSMTQVYCKLSDLIST
jgi:hypothetical protein